MSSYKSLTNVSHKDTLRKIIRMKTKKNSTRIVLDKNKLQDDFELFKEIQKELIDEKKLLYTNFVFSIFSAVLLDNPVFIVDIKIVVFTKEELKDFIQRILSIENKKEYSDCILKKIGYIYDEERQMVSMVYHKGKNEFFSLDNIIKKVRKNENVIKLALVREIFENKSSLLSLRTNILHPYLLFYSDKRGLVYFDFIFSIIYEMKKELIADYILNYYGIFDKEEESNSVNNLIISFLIYIFGNKLSNDSGDDVNTSVLIFDNENNDEANEKKIPYELILQKLKKDYLLKEPELPNLFSLIDENQKILKNFLSSINLTEEVSISQISTQFQNEYYSKIIKFYAVCENCKINSKQLSPTKFVIHFPCYKIFCSNCLSGHKCLNDFRSELNHDKNFIREQKDLFDFLPEIKMNNLEGLYTTNFEDVLSKMAADNLKIRVKAINTEEKVNNFIKLLTKKLNKDFSEVKEKYKRDLNLGKKNCKKSLDEIIDLKDRKTKLFKSVICDASKDLDKINKINENAADIINIVQKEIPRRLDVLVSGLIRESSNLINKENYGLDTFVINEINPESGFSKISILNTENNSVYIYDMIEKTHSIVKLNEAACTNNKKVYFHKGAKSTNLKGGVLLTGGMESSDAYLYNYSTELLIELPKMVYHHKDHSTIKIERSSVLVVGGNCIKCEAYNFLTNEWEIKSDLPYPINNSVLFLHNEMDLYLLFGEYLHDADYIRSHFVYKLELFGGEEKWNKIDFKNDFDEFTPPIKFGVVPMKDNNSLLILRGEIYNNAQEVEKNVHVFFYDIKKRRIVKRKNYQELRGSSIQKQYPNFESGLFTSMDGSHYYNWGEDLKIVHISNK